MAEPLTRWFDAPVGGEAPSMPPDLIGGTLARSLRNWLVHHPGRIVPRGGIGGPGASESGSLSHPDGNPMASHFTLGEDIAIHYREAQAAPTVDAWRVPINKPTSSAQLSQAKLGAQAGRVVDMDDGTTTDLGLAVTTAELNGVAGYQHARLIGFLYTNTFGGESVAIPTGVAQKTVITKNTGVAGVRLTNGPVFVMDVFQHMGRIFSLAARDPGGSNYAPATLYYTIPGGTTALTDVVTDWQDPVTGEQNRIAIGDPTDGDFGVALGRAAGHLVVFLRNSIWILYGTAPANFTLRQLRTVHGCVDARSVVTSDSGVYFASQRGFERFDGETFELLSEPVSDTWLEFSNRGPGANTVNQSYIKAAALKNNYLHIALGTDPHAVNQPDGAERNWLLHSPTGAWIDMRSAITGMGLGSAGAFNRAIATPGSVSLWGASKWARADNLVFGLPTSTGLVDRFSSSSHSVELVWTTRVDNLAGGRWNTAALSSITADYHQHYTTADPPDLDPWGTLAATDGFGDSLVVGTLSLPGYDTPGPIRSRPTFVPKPESKRGDITFTMTSNIGSSATKRTAKLEVYGLGVTFHTGRERRTA